MNQKTTKAERTRSKLARSNNRPSNDTNPLRKFEVTLSFIQQSWAEVIIDAGSLAEAEEKASKIEADEVKKWNSCEFRVEVHTVDPVEGDRNDD
jgi:hypothetical protein